VREGVERLNNHQRTFWDEHDTGDSPNPHLVDQLRIYEQDIRKKFSVEKTLREQLDEAIAQEDYELAARLRDQILAKAKARR
jgi:UvrB/uvrC motif